MRRVRLRAPFHEAVQMPNDAVAPLGQDPEITIVQANLMPRINPPGQGNVLGTEPPREAQSPGDDFDALRAGRPPAEVFKSERRTIAHAPIVTHTEVPSTLRDAFIAPNKADGGQSTIAGFSRLQRPPPRGHHVPSRRSLSVERTPDRLPRYPDGSPVDRLEAKSAGPVRMK